MTANIGWFYLLVIFIFIVFLLYLALSKYGRIRLGKDYESPEYSSFSWFFMLFAAGMGIGLVFWGAAEPLSHFLTPATAEPGTAEAACDAMRASFTHWGIHPWAIYAIFGLPLAYYGFRKGKPALLSSCVEPLAREKHFPDVLGKAIDVLAVVATVFGVATSLGLGAMQINSGLNYVFGVPYNNIVSFGIITIATILFIVSSVSGIDRGIKFLSDSNMVIMALLMLFVFCAGATLFVTDFFIDSMGGYLQNLIEISLWTDPFNVSDGWLDSWTVFYWAWWMSWGPFVGGFIARISRGRTIREFIIGVLFCPMVLCCLFMVIFGGNAIYETMNGVTAISEALSQDVSYTLFALLQQYPLATFTSIMAMILLLVFFITSANSSTFVCAMMTSGGVQNPPDVLKVTWGLFEGIVAALLLYVGGLSAVQSISIAMAFPMMLLCLAMMVALLRTLRTEKI